MQLIIADDHPIFRSGLKMLLFNAFPAAVIFDYSDGEEALQAILDKKPDVAILDIDMPGKNGLDVCTELQKKSPTKVIVLTMYKDREMIHKAFYNGAKGYLVKDNTSEELVECVNEVLEGNSFIAKEIRGLAEEGKKVDKKIDAIEEALNSLTQTELKTLKLVSQKYTSRQIADLLFISVKSVENYRSRVCKKLNLDARNNSLLLWVMENKSLLDRVKEF
ncbi:MAG: response regulator [Flavobacteriales bacterium]